MGCHFPSGIHISAEGVSEMEVAVYNHRISLPHGTVHPNVLSLAPHAVPEVAGIDFSDKFQLKKN